MKIENSTWIKLGYICPVIAFFILSVPLGIFGLYIASKNIDNGYKKHGLAQFVVIILAVVLGIKFQANYM